MFIIRGSGAVTLPAVEMSNIGVSLRPAPIEPSWIIEGSPKARNALISRSRDGTADTLVWDCSPGKFMWHYHTEETIHFLEGQVVLDDGTGPRRVGPGDVIFIPAGAKVHWTVEQHVRKLAFFRKQLPKPVELLVNALRRVKQMVKGAPPPVMAGMGDASLA